MARSANRGTYNLWGREKKQFNLCNRENKNLQNNTKIRAREIHILPCIHTRCLRILLLKILRNVKTNRVRSRLPFLPHNYGIRFQIAHVDRVTLGDDVGMGRYEQPPHVSVEETSPHVVGIRVGFAVLVMHPMIQRPCVHVSLRIREKNIM